MFNEGIEGELKAISIRLLGINAGDSRIQKYKIISIKQFRKVKH